MHMHANDFSCMHIYMPKFRMCHFAPYLLPQHNPPTRSQPPGNRGNVSLRVEYSSMSFSTLTLHMQNVLLCIHVETQTGGTTKNVISLPTASLTLIY